MAKLLPNSPERHFTSKDQELVFSAKMLKTPDLDGILTSILVTNKLN